MEIPIYAAEPDRTDALGDLVGFLSDTEMDTDDKIAHHAASPPPRSPSPLPMDTSFGSFAIPEDYQEESMMLPPPPEVVHAPLAPLTYETITSSTQRGKEKLVDSMGYSYIQKKPEKNGVIWWRCSVRNKTTLCKMTVRQCGDIFVRGSQQHIHPPVAGTAIASKISRDIKVS